MIHFNNTIKLIKTSCQLKQIKIPIVSNNQTLIYTHLTTCPTIIFDHKINRINNYINFDISNIYDFQNIINTNSFLNTFPVNFFGSEIVELNNGVFIVIFRKDLVRFSTSIYPSNFLNKQIYNFNNDDNDDFKNTVTGNYIFSV
jgi:hypothetical protein